MIVLAALTASPAAALAIGALFGLVRGLAVLLGRGITSPATLAAFHRRFTGPGPSCSVSWWPASWRSRSPSPPSSRPGSPWRSLLLGAAAAASRLRRRTPATARP